MSRPSVVPTSPEFREHIAIPSKGPASPCNISIPSFYLLFGLGGYKSRTMLIAVWASVFPSILLRPNDNLHQFSLSGFTPKAQLVVRRKTDRYHSFGTHPLFEDRKSTLRKGRKGKGFITSYLKYFHLIPHFCKVTVVTLDNWVCDHSSLASIRPCHTILLLLTWWWMPDKSPFSLPVSFSVRDVMGLVVGSYKISVCT